MNMTITEGARDQLRRAIVASRRLVNTFVPDPDLAIELQNGQTYVRYDRVVIESDGARGDGLLARLYWRGEVMSSVRVPVCRLHEGDVLHLHGVEGRQRIHVDGDNAIGRTALDATRAAWHFTVRGSLLGPALASLGMYVLSNALLPHSALHWHTSVSVFAAAVLVSSFFRKGRPQ